MAANEGDGIGRGGGATRRITLVVPPHRLYADLGEMLRDVLERAGWTVSIEHEAPASLLDCDVVLMAGGCDQIPGLRRRLEARSSGRPTTLLWQLEPLPAPGLSPTGERVGRRLARVHWAALPSPWRSIANAVVPCRNAWLRGVRRVLARPYARELARDPRTASTGPLDVPAFTFAMRQYAWLAEAHAAGLIDHLFTSTRPRVAFLASRGLRASFVSVGYHPGWGHDRSVERDLDVVFLGSVRRTRRGRLLKRLGAELAARGHRLTVVNRGCYGRERDDLLSRARIVLNFVKFPWDFPGMRMLMTLGCGALVVSESSDDPAPYRPGEHFVEAPVDRLAAVINELLDDEPDRARRATAGQRFVTTELTLERSVATMLERSGLGQPVMEVVA